ncbi:MAG: hypothetical protein HY731_10310 [Candidatus Tectomicrobia bacterium]|nr:hypothetical protein [Candidatus Tectomicrobia bacterium]
MNLGTREKIIVISGVMFTILFVVYQFFLNPKIERFKRLDALILQEEKTLRELLKLRQDYLAKRELIREISKGVAQRDRGLPIFSVLEELATKSKVKGNIQYIKPSTPTVGELYKESSVEIRLEGVNLTQLISYLYEIGSSPHFLKVQRLHVKPRSGNRQVLDVTFQVSTFDLLEGKGA